MNRKVSSDNFRIDMEFKLLMSFLIVIFVASTYKGNYPVLLLYFFADFSAVLLFKPLWKLFLKRAFIVFLFPLSISVFIPFISEGNAVFLINMHFFKMIITDNGITVFLTTILKSFLAIIILAALITSSGDLEILNGLRRMHFPGVIVSIIFLMYRYIFLIRDEAKAGQLAISSRVFQKTYYNVNKRLTFLAGNLFIKSFDRAERIYRSMESRGFEGEFNITPESKKPGISNILIFSFFAFALAVIKIIELLKILK